MGHFSQLRSFADIRRIRQLFWFLIIFGSKSHYRENKPIFKKWYQNRNLELIVRELDFDF